MTQAHWVEVRFATLYQQSSNTSQILKRVRYYVVIRSRTCRYCEISKKLTLNPTLSAKNTPLFPLSDMRRSCKIFAWGMPLCAHVFSFTHNAEVLLHFRCVHPESHTKLFLILTFLWIQTNVAYTSLEVNNVVHYKYSLSPVSNWFVTLY